MSYTVRNPKDRFSGYGDQLGLLELLLLSLFSGGAICTVNCDWFLLLILFCVCEIKYVCIDFAMCN